MPAPSREARGARRRRETRTRLLNAALKLMAERGMDAVAVNEITEAADVGFGSFYNHFASKEAIHDALIEQVFEEFGNALDEALAGLGDPAEVMAASVRHTLHRARADTTWGQFLLREGLSDRMMTRGLGTRLMRDLQHGFAERRYSGDDILVAFLMIAGSVLSALAAEVQYGEHGRAPLPEEQRAQLRLHGADLPERIAAGVLRSLGLDATEAARIARLPLATLRVDGLRGA
jgi:AcrR family transcriptional regulator